LEGFGNCETRKRKRLTQRTGEGIGGRDMMLKEIKEEMVAGRERTAQLSANSGNSRLFVLGQLNAFDSMLKLIDKAIIADEKKRLGGGKD